jgi:hypothetical protein
MKRSDFCADEAKPAYFCCSLRVFYLQSASLIGLVAYSFQIKICFEKRSDYTFGAWKDVNNNAAGIN